MRNKKNSFIYYNVKKIVRIVLFCILFFSNVYAQTYSIKKRWTINSTYSLYGIWERTQPFIMTEAQFNDPNYYWQKQRSNVRLNVNYGVLNYLEIGGYIGFMHYPAEKVISTYQIPVDSIHYIIGLNTKESQKLAPTFGININFHILPFFNTDPKCKWDLYVNAKYGGCYFISYKNDYSIPISFNYHKDELYAYRHEYGIGIGGSVYFWNLLGFNSELSIGQFSYWPHIFSSNFNIRVGIIFKLNANRKKIYI